MTRQVAIASSFAMLCFAALRAAAQSPFITYHWSWQEVLAGTTTPVAQPNGLLEPGESALLRLTIAFEPPVGTLFPVPGAPNATVAAFAGSLIQLNGWIGINSWAQGTFSHLSMRQPWGRDPGLPYQTNAHLNGIHFFQGWPLLAPPDPENPIVHIWQGVWTPLTYTPHTITFQSMRQEPFGG